MRVCGGYRASASRRLWRIAVLTAAGATGGISQAEAQLSYWSDSSPEFSHYEPMPSHRPPKARRHQAKKLEAPAKVAGKPQGPLIIAISIDKQNLRLYDANGFYAQTPVSTGMRGHSTPMGVFSVIQKHKFHHSNIYSGAPMPYMQRITWSGVAIHAGVLPGYPASHGCIRMPMAFAVKMWGWTRMGARVIITPGEITPASFAHPLLVAQKIAPQPVAAEEPKPDALPVVHPDKASDAGSSGKSALAETTLELKPSVGHDDGVKPVVAAPSASIPWRDPTRTADASSTLPKTNASATMTDATSSGSPLSPKAEPAEAKPLEAATVEAKPAEAKPAGIEPGPIENPDESIKAATDVPGIPGVKTDPDTGKAAVSMPAPAIAVAPKRSGQISVLVSRKDSKLYVRQNFAPLFDVPVTIAPSDRPLGTHVFTAQADKNDANVLHWSVISLPVRVRYTERSDGDEQALRRRKASAVELKSAPVADSPAEALDRLTIPADAMARIAEALSTGGSIIVSDQGINSGETGEGTDFIVSLR